MRASSASSTEAAALAIAGFRVEREIRRSAGTVVYEAIQTDLERRVALTVLAGDDPRAQRFRASAWPEHPHVVRLYAAGMSEQRLFIATRFVPAATTLAQRVAAGDDAGGWLADVREALAATGAVHGALDDEASLLVDRDGRVLIAGFGLGPPAATAADDERALARLEREARGHAAGRRRARPWRRLRAIAAADDERALARLEREACGHAAGRRRARMSRRWRAAVAGAAVAMAATAVGAVALLAGPGTAGKDERSAPAPAPAVAAGLVALGSALAPRPATAVDCDGAPPSGRSLGCTAMQTALTRRALAAPRDGVIRAWHVRGARGEVAMRVIRRRGTRFYMIGGSDFEAVGGGLNSFRAGVTIRRGDLVGLELAPGSGAGFRDAPRSATTTRFIGALRYGHPRVPNPAPASGGGEELLLRVDYAPGHALTPVRLTGAAARSAPGGRRVDEREIALDGGRTVTVAAVALADAVVLDVLEGGRRQARIDLPGADPTGRPLLFTPVGEPDLTFAWRNPGGERVDARYRVTATSIAPLD